MLPVFRSWLSLSCGFSSHACPSSSQNCARNLKRCLATSASREGDTPVDGAAAWTHIKLCVSAQCYPL